jgi:hypothetical protein
MTYLACRREHVSSLPDHGQGHSLRHVQHGCRWLVAVLQ